MRGRCNNPNNEDYPNYGGRGITVCERWMHYFENFLEDMGRRPSLKHSIERIDNNGNYEPLNCKWATKKEQNRNKRNVRSLTVNGVTKLICEWGDGLGVKSHTILGRIKRGWSLEDAVYLKSENVKLHQRVRQITNLEK